MLPCSCGLSRANAPFRRSGYHTAHGQAGLSAVRRGRRKSHSSRSASKPVNTCNCMYRRRSLVCPLAPCSRTSTFALSALTCPPLATARVHFEVRIALELTDLHQRPTVASGQPLLGAAIGTASPPAGDPFDQLLAPGAGAQRPAQIDALDGVEAGGPHAVGRQPTAVARSAERRGRRRSGSERRAVRRA